MRITRIETSSNPALITTWVVQMTTALSAALVMASTGAGAGGGSPTLASLLAGNTLSAVTWAPRSPATPGGGALSRFMLQAYLRQDGSALIRVWAGSQYLREAGGTLLDGVRQQALLRAANPRT